MTLIFLDACHPTALILGDDMRVCPLWELCGLWRSGQHLLHIQFEDPRGQCACHQRAAWTHR